MAPSVDEYFQLDVEIRIFLFRISKITVNIVPNKNMYLFFNKTKQYIKLLVAKRKDFS